MHSYYLSLSNLLNALHMLSDKKNTSVWSLDDSGEQIILRKSGSDITFSYNENLLSLDFEKFYSEAALLSKKIIDELESYNPSVATESACLDLIKCISRAKS